MTPSLNNTNQSIINGNASICVVDNFQSIRGGRSLDTTGFYPTVIKEGHVVIKETATGVLKPMPATDERVNNIATVNTLVAGSAYTNGTYENVPLTGGTGTGALATVTVAGAVVTGIAITFGGKDYTVGDVLSFNNTNAGGTGSGSTITVATVSTVAAAYGSLPAGHTYHSIVISDTLTAKPFAGLLVRGNVNPAAAPYSMTSILSAVKTALPLITFLED